MGTNQRFHGNGKGKNVPKSSSKQDSEVGLGLAIFKFVTQGCLGTRKNSSRNQETKHHHHPRHQRLNHGYSKGVTTPGPVTLAEWIMESPCLNGSSELGDSSLMVVSRSVSRRVHPSTLDRRRTKVESGGIHEDSFSFSTRQLVQQSGKLKKKVSFKEPEVADVFILKDSPEEVAANVS